MGEAEACGPTPLLWIGPTAVDYADRYGTRRVSGCPGLFATSVITVGCVNVAWVRLYRCQLRGGKDFFCTGRGDGETVRALIGTGWTRNERTERVL